MLWVLRAAARTVTHPVFLCALAACLVVHLWTYGRGYPVPMIRGDGWGFYVPLPAAFVYGDLSLRFLNTPGLPREVTFVRSRTGDWPGLSVTDQGGYLDKYPVGTAVLQLPWFLGALAVAKLTTANITGFERPFQVASAVSAAFYAALGAYFLYRAGRLRFGRWPLALALAFTFGATNLLFYASFDGAYSHVYGFCLVAALVWLVVSRLELGGAPPLGEFVVFGGLMGLMIMVRPTNVVCGLLILPFVQGASRQRLLLGGAAGLAAMVIATFPQLLLWLSTTGQLIYYSYGGESFRFASPRPVDYLFLTAKGLFFWHPAYLFMILALVMQITKPAPDAAAVAATADRPPRRLSRARRRAARDDESPLRPEGAGRRETAAVLPIVGIALYVGASWTDVTFGDSFGARHAIELLPLLVLPLAGVLTIIRGTAWRCLIGGVGIALMAVNLVQMDGYMFESLPHNNTTPTQYVQFWQGKLRIR